jgi:hypothetical protein
MFGHKRKEVAEHWKQFYNVELYGICPLPNFIGVVEIRRMIRAGCVARMGDNRDTYRDLMGKPEGNIPLGDLAYDGKIILIPTLNKYCGIT